MFMSFITNSTYRFVEVKYKKKQQQQQSLQLSEAKSNHMTSEMSKENTHDFFFVFIRSLPLPALRFNFI